MKNNVGGHRMISAFEKRKSCTYRDGQGFYKWPKNRLRGMVKTNKRFNKKQIPSI